MVVKQQKQKHRKKLLFWLGVGLLLLPTLSVGKGLANTGNPQNEADVNSDEVTIACAGPSVGTPTVRSNKTARVSVGASTCGDSRGVKQVDYKISTLSSCGPGGAWKVITATGTGTSYSSRVLTKSDDGDKICFRAKQRVTSHLTGITTWSNYSYGGVKTIKPNPPVSIGDININTSAKTTTTSVSGGWGEGLHVRAKVVASESACTGLGGSNLSSSPYTFSFSDSDYGKWVCYRAKDQGVGSYVYKSKKIEPPAVTVSVGTPNKGLNQVTATVSGGNPSKNWQVEVEQMSSSSKCSSSGWGNRDHNFSPYSKNTTYTYNYSLKYHLGNYICFRAKRVGGSFEYRSSTNISVSSISLGSITYDSSAKAQVTASGGYSSGQWFTGSKVVGRFSSCGPSSGITTSASPSSSSFIVKSQVLTSSDDGKTVCFKVTRGSGKPVSYKSKTINYYKDVVPTVTIGAITLNNNHQAVTTIYGGDSSGIWDVRYGITNSGSCTSSNTNTSTTQSSPKTRALTWSDNGYKVCFRAKRGNSSWVYKHKAFSWSSLSASASISGSWASVQVSGGGPFAATTYAKMSSSTSCGGLTYGVSGYSPPNSTNLYFADNGGYICYKVTKAGQTAVYAYKSVSNIAPMSASTSITFLSRDRGSARATLTITGGDTGVSGKTQPSVSYKITSSSSCSGNSGFSSTSRNITLNYSHNNKYLCWRVSNTSTYNHTSTKYASQWISGLVLATKITLTQDGDTVKATASSSSNFKYFKSSTDPTCSDSTSGVTWVSGKTATGLTDNQWVCFKATTFNTNIYGKLQADLRQPAITLVVSSDNKTITASGRNLADYNYFKSDTNPTCNASKTTGWTSGLAVSGLVDNQWACFKAKNSLGVYGFAKKQTGIVPPTITFTQTQTQVTATATASKNNKTVTASSWQYFKTSDTKTPSCNSSDSSSFNTASSSNTTVAITKADIDKWLCFRVKDNLNAYGYAKYRIDYTPPFILITQVKKQITASSSASDLKTSNPFAHQGPFDSETTCSSLTTGWTNGKTIASATIGKHYCFKAQDKAGNIGYLSYQALTGIELLADKLAIKIHPKYHYSSNNSDTGRGSASSTHLWLDSVQAAINGGGHKYKSTVYSQISTNTPGNICPEANYILNKQANYLVTPEKSHLNNGKYICYKAVKKNDRGVIETAYASYLLKDLDPFRLSIRHEFEPDGSNHRLYLNAFGGGINSATPADRSQLKVYYKKLDLGIPCDGRQKSSPYRQTTTYSETFHVNKNRQGGYSYKLVSSDWGKRICFRVDRVSKTNSNTVLESQWGDALLAGKPIYCKIMTSSSSRVKIGTCPKLNNWYETGYILTGVTAKTAYSYNQGRYHVIHGKDLVVTKRQ